MDLAAFRGRAGVHVLSCHLGAVVPVLKAYSGGMSVAELFTYPAGLCGSGELGGVDGVMKVGTSIARITDVVMADLLIVAVARRRVVARRFADLMSLAWLLRASSSAVAFRTSSRRLAFRAALVLVWAPSPSVAGAGEAGTCSLLGGVLSWSRECAGERLCFKL